ncbi:MAG: allantoate amidohydrolase [Solirubrobacterales bacterium]|nr:allantoate amidohydrolase [Solirubrobacterales bacterium]
MPATDLATTVLARCDELAGLTEEPGRLTRRYATPALRAAGDAVGGWMREAGMTVRRDAVGNVIGRREGGPRTLLLGSHLDTVVDAGRYDGALGVLVALAAVERAADLPYAVEVYGFADEEGVRFGTAYLGSGAVVGAPLPLERVDADGVRLADVLRTDPVDARRDPAGLIGYVEVHIEQGPALEEAGAPLGVVTAIAGQTRSTVAFHGRAGHAGTVPMDLRHDALAGAAEWVGTVEAAGAEEAGLLATVGELTVEPGASNVIPGRVNASLDVRHAEDRARRAANERLRARAEEIADARGLRLQWQTVLDTVAVACDPTLSDLLARAAGPDVPRLASGAGHDAVMMSRIAPAAMLFVRCAGGISHHPAESVAHDDVAAAIDATTRFLEEVR